MGKLDFKKLIPLFEANEEFSLTESQYEKQVGKALPKNAGYLKKDSAIAKEAKKYGFFIEIKERTICLKKKVG